MLNVFEIADILVENVRRKFPESVAIVAYYGSYANGTATPLSDLDIFFIPDGPGAYGASLQFIIGGIGFDFWPISWERAERIAAFDEPIVSVIADCRVLYSRKVADLSRLEGLQRKIKSMSRPENRSTMLRKARSALNDSYRHLFGVIQATRAEDLSGTRRYAAKLASSVVQSVALANQTYFKKGMGQNSAEIAALRLKPEGLCANLKSISSSSECSQILTSCEELVGETTSFLNAEDARLRRASFADVFQGFHEEALSTYNKVRTACERGDRETAFHASMNLQEELRSGLEMAEGKGVYQALGLPDLAARYDAGELGELASAVSDLEAKFRGVLRSRKVNVNQFDSPDGLRKFLAASPAPK